MADEKALALIQEEQVEAFNQLVEANGGTVDLSNSHLRAYDLRKCKLRRANLSGAYMRAADLRSVDLSEAILDGASIKEAKVSGVLFPRDLSPQEIILGLVHGTRLRQGL